MQWNTMQRPFGRLSSFKANAQLKEQFAGLATFLASVRCYVSKLFDLVVAGFRLP